jgi:hypothetical protein
LQLAQSSSAGAVAVSGIATRPAAEQVLVWGCTAAALVSAALLSLGPVALALLLPIDLWALGFPHIVATFTRTAWDASDRRKHRFLLTALPAMVLVVIGAGVCLVGTSAVVSVYLYVQWFHYTRQSYGIYRALHKKASPKTTPPGQGTLAYAVIYTTGLAGILFRSYGREPLFFGIKVFYIPVPFVAVVVACIVAGACLFAWLARRAATWRSRGFGISGQLPTEDVFVLTHVLVFTLGYVLIPNAGAGWVVVNVWHNAQYISFVWQANRRRVSTAKPQPELGRLGDYLRRGAWHHYLILCGLVSSVVYSVITWLPTWAPWGAAISLGFVAIQTLNFHHYIVDAVIWRRPRGPALQPSTA